MEDRLVYDSRYQVGIAQVDLEHEGLFRLASAIYDRLSVDVISPMGEIRTALDELISNTDSHFANEEALMEAAGYPLLAEHRALHSALMSRIRSFESEIEKAGDLTPVDVYEFLCSWLGDHILTSDRMFGEFVARTPSAQAQ